MATKNGLPETVNEWKLTAVHAILAGSTPEQLGYIVARGVHEFLRCVKRTDGPVPLTTDEWKDVYFLLKRTMRESITVPQPTRVM